MIEGKLISTHPHNKEKEAGIALLVIMLVIAGVAYFSFEIIPTQLIFMFAMMIPVSIWVAITSTYRLWLQPEIELYEFGLRYTDKRGTKFWTWDKIDNIRALRSLSSENGRFGLYDGKQRVVLLNDRFQRNAVLVNSVMGTMQSRASYETIFNQGKTLEAGKLSVNRNGIQIKNGELIRWVDVRHIQAIKQLTELQLDYADNKTKTVQIHNIPNAPLLMQFVTTKFNELINLPSITEEQSDVKPRLSLEAPLVRHNAIFRIFVAIISLGVSLYIIADGLSNALEYDLITLSWFGGMLLTLIIPAIAIIVLLQDGKLLWQNPRLQVDKTGLHYTIRSGSTHWDWQEFSDIRLEKVYSWLKGVHIAYILDVGGQHALTLDDRFARFADLGNLVQQNHTHALYSQFKSDFDRGETLSFGTIIVDQVGIRFGKQSYSWSEVASFDLLNIGETHILFYSNSGDRLFGTTIFGISNIQILRLLLQEQITKGPPNFENLSSGSLAT